MTRVAPVLMSLFAAAATGSLPSQDIEDGIYIATAVEATAEGDGPRVKRIDGGEIVLKKLLSQRFGSAKVTSTSNDNSRFLLQLKDAGTMPAEAAKNRLAVHVAGFCMVVSSHSELRDDKYRIGETITLEMVIENVGGETFTFWDGGMQRGARNNQFGFMAYRSQGFGRAVADTGDPTNFGGIAVQRRLKPGGTFVKEVRLSRWFKFEKADTYRITGMFRMGIHNVGEHRPSWDDFAVGECLVRVVQQPAKNK